MKYLRTTATMAALLALMAAAPSPVLVNGDFEQHDGAAPVGWVGPSTADPGERAAYEFGVVDGGHAGGAGLLRRTGAESADRFGSLSQRIDATPYRGKRVRFRAWVRADVPADGAAGLWMRVDLPNRTIGFFDNMHDRPITADGWKAYDIEGYVARRAERLVVGLILNGAGSAWIDDASVEVVDAAPDTTDASLTPAAKAYLDKALETLERLHINSRKVDWPEMRADAYAAAAGARDPAGTHASIEAAVSALGEQHSFFARPRPPAPPAPPETAPAPRPGLGNRPPTGELRGRVGLVALPGLATRDEAELAFGETYTATLQALLAGHDRAGVCGWIVDLRNDTGGNMWPMLNGLSPILGPGPYGAFVTPDGTRRRWVRDSGRIEIEGTQDRPASVPRFRAANSPVAVLIGPRTVSSGEMTAVAFRGRPKTRFFGQPTGGLTTANSTIPMDDGATLIVTSAYIVDRNGVDFTGAIAPDEAVPLDQADMAAEAWLSTQGCGKVG